jgi:hypothetical protein
MAIINNFYPPVLSTYMPAFIADADDSLCKVYFSISDYNSIGDIKNAQITVLNQNTNLTVLDSTKYPSEIALKEIKIDDTKTSDDKYYIEIKNTDLKNEKFEIDTYYKVQIRFTGADAADISLSTPQALDSWLAANLNNFSEWSTVCLIRGISTPALSISGFEIIDGKVSWSLANSNLIGNLTFADEDETETLRQYQVRLYSADGTLLTDSGILYSNNYNNPNSFIYTFKYNFEVDNSYYFTVDYQTQNLYEGSNKITFTVAQDSNEELDFSFTIKEDAENGRFQISLKRTSETEYTGKIIIRRTSSESNFTIWEDIHTIDFNKVTNVKETWYDNTIKSGVWYNYYIQGIDAKKNRGLAKINKKPMMIILDDMFLTTKNRQLKIKFNPSVSSLKRTISEIKTETIGSAYPFIRRNGAVNYIQLPISGLISYLIDEDETFISKDEIYGNNKKKYEKYNETNKITTYNDYTYEKLFRDAVSDFLYDGEAKLFRSATEGNFLVKLMDVSFTPENSLGRMIWSFSATAYEIDEDTIDNYELYNIIEERS